MSSFRALHMPEIEWQCTHFLKKIFLGVDQSSGMEKHTLQIEIKVQQQQEQNAPHIDVMQQQQALMY